MIFYISLKISYNSDRNCYKQKENGTKQNKPQIKTNKWTETWSNQDSSDSLNVCINISTNNQIHVLLFHN